MTLPRHPSRRVFTAGVGVAGGPVSDDWSALDQDQLWFAKPPKQVCRGDHIFALAAGRGSVVLGLFEVTSGGPERRPNPWDPQRWPWAIGVRPIAGMSPRVAVSANGVRAPRATAVRVRDEVAIEALYSALELPSW